MIKVNAVFCGLFLLKKAEKEIEELKYFNTKNAPIYTDTNLVSWFNENVLKPILVDLQEFSEKESGKFSNLALIVTFIFLLYI